MNAIFTSFTFTYFSPFGKNNFTISPPQTTTKKKKKIMKDDAMTYTDNDSAQIIEYIFN